MITSVVIIILSVALFVYWFRYSCILILSSRWNEDEALVVANQNDLSFGTIDETLARVESTEALDRVKDLLDRDLDRVVSLLARCPVVEEAGQSLECRMLMFDYQIMRAWYAVTRSFASPKAHQALREMAHIVGYIAGEYGSQMSTART
jgi:hypothetical protein